MLNLSSIPCVPYNVFFLTLHTSIMKYSLLFPTARDGIITVQMYNTICRTDIIQNQFSSVQILYSFIPQGAF